MHRYTVQVSETPATCEAEGSRVFQCSEAGCTATYTEVLPMTARIEELDPAVAPTCTEPGLTEGSHCKICGYVIIAQTVVPAPGHSYGPWQVKTDCTPTKDGVVAQTCANCGSDATAVMDKHTHAPDAQGNCEICSYPLVAKAIAALPDPEAETFVVDYIYFATLKDAITNAPVLVEEGTSFRAVALTQDIALNEPVTLTDAGYLLLALNGHTLTNAKPFGADRALLEAIGATTLDLCNAFADLEPAAAGLLQTLPGDCSALLVNVSGDHTVDMSDVNIVGSTHAVCVKGGQANLHNGQYAVQNADNSQLVTCAADAIRLMGGAQLSISHNVKGHIIGSTSAVLVLEGQAGIEGGIYSVTAADTSKVLACDPTNYTTFDQNGSRLADFVVRGGTYVNFDPANNTAQGPATEFVSQTEDPAWSAVSIPSAAGWQVVYEPAAISAGYRYLGGRTGYATLQEAFDNAPLVDGNHRIVSLLEQVDLTAGMQLTLSANVVLRSNREDLLVSGGTINTQGQYSLSKETGEAWNGTAWDPAP